MWLTRQFEQKAGAQVTSGEVSGGETLTVTGESVHIAPQLLLPYGFSSTPPSGNQAVLLNGMCAGVAAVQDSRLEEGEVCLYSAGGAEILLKNDGTVVINGQVFAKK